MPSKEVKKTVRVKTQAQTASTPKKNKNTTISDIVETSTCMLAMPFGLLLEKKTGKVQAQSQKTTKKTITKPKTHESPKKGGGCALCSLGGGAKKTNKPNQTGRGQQRVQQQLINEFKNLTSELQVMLNNY